MEINVSLHVQGPLEVCMPYVSNSAPYIRKQAKHEHVTISARAPTSSNRHRTRQMIITAGSAVIDTLAWVISKLDAWFVS